MGPGIEGQAVLLRGRRYRLRNDDYNSANRFRLRTLLLTGSYSDTDRMNDIKLKVETYLALALILILFIGCVLVLFPFVSALAWAMILCYSCWPIYERLLNALKGRRTLAALVMAVLITLVILLPFVVVGISLSDNVHDLSVAAHRWVDEGLPPAPTWLGKVPMAGSFLVQQWNSLGSLNAGLFKQLKGVIEPLSGWLLKIGIASGLGLTRMALSIFITFFLFRDGRAMADWLQSAINQIAGERGKQMLMLAGQTVRGVVYGILGTAIVQAVMAGIGFLIAGVPGALLLGFLTFFLSVVPAGPPLIWIPVSIWLFSQGRTGWGIFMIVWGVGVSSVDNVVKPWLISQGSDLPFLLIFFGVLGGAMAFGFIGVFLGPTLIAVGYRIVTEWVAENRASKEATPALPGI
ncbi:MAG: putative inner rane protein [Verrucomicrobiales bacterium]|nr:putative inner rane protein [Verrucomicrobiales bacterium]